MTWNPNSVRLSRDQTLRSLRRVSRDGGTFTFAAGDPALAALKAGQILLVWGIGGGGKKERGGEEGGEERGERGEEGGGEGGGGKSFDRDSISPFCNDARKHWLNDQPIR